MMDEKRLAEIENDTWPSNTCSAIRELLAGVRRLRAHLDPGQVSTVRLLERERCAKVIDAAGFLDVEPDDNGHPVERPAGDLLRALPDEP